MKIAFLAAWAVFTAASAALRVFQLDRYVAGGLFTSQSLLQYGAIAGALLLCILLALFCARGEPRGRRDGSARPGWGGVLCALGILVAGVGAAQLVFLFLGGRVPLARLGLYAFAVLFGVGLFGCGRYLSGAASRLPVLCALYPGYTLVLLIAGRAVSALVSQGGLELLSCCTACFFFVHAAGAMGAQWGGDRVRKGTFWGLLHLFCFALATFPPAVLSLGGGSAFALGDLLGLALDLLYFAAGLVLCLYLAGELDPARVAGEHLAPAAGIPLADRAQLFYTADREEGPEGPPAAEKRAALPRGEGRGKAAPAADGEQPEGPSAGAAPPAPPPAKRSAPSAPRRSSGPRRAAGRGDGAYVYRPRSKREGGPRRGR